jgi:TetR/AcrR family transcriptional regulator, cholesterol catabolism regulator
MKQNKLNDMTKKEKIVKSASTLFMRHGFNKTSMRQIAKYSGMATSTLYYYVKSKNDILLLFQNVDYRNVHSIIDESIAKLKYMSASKALESFIADCLSESEEYQDMIIFWYQELKNVETNDRNHIYSSQWDLVVHLTKLLKKGCELGEFEIDDLEAVSNNILVICEMWAFRRWLLRSRYTLKQYTKQQTKFILAAISKHASLDHQLAGKERKGSPANQDLRVPKRHYKQ